jgi:hypothetical protein
MLDLLGKSGKVGSENGDFGHESHPFRHPFDDSLRGGRWSSVPEISRWPSLFS